MCIRRVIYEKEPNILCPIHPIHNDVSSFEMPLSPRDDVGLNPRNNRSVPCSPTHEIVFNMYVARIRWFSCLAALGFVIRLEWKLIVNKVYFSLLLP